MSSQTKRDFGLFVNKSQGSCKEKKIHVIFMTKGESSVVRSTILSK